MRVKRRPRLVGADSIVARQADVAEVALQEQLLLQHLRLVVLSRDQAAEEEEEVALRSHCHY